VTYNFKGENNAGAVGDYRLPLLHVNKDKSLKEALVNSSK